MIYGTLTTARAWHDAVRIDEWLQLFLRADGKNLALAEGLLEEEPIHFGLRHIPVSLLKQVQSGAAHVSAVLWAPDAQSAAELTAFLDREAAHE